MEEQQQWGLTKAISMSEPTKADLELNDRLVEGLKARGNFETPEGSEIRYIAILNPPAWVWSVY